MATVGVRGLMAHQHN